MDERILAQGPLAHPSPTDQDTPHGCYDGWIFLGFETEEGGELVEITDRVPCRRCAIEHYEAHQAMEAPSAEAFLPFHSPAPGVRPVDDDEL